MSASFRGIYQTVRAAAGERRNSTAQYRQVRVDIISFQAGPL